MKDNKNAHWTISEIAHQYKIENLDWDWNRCYKEAKIIYKELNKLNKETWDGNRLYFKFNIPFSDFKGKDDEFSDTYYDFENRE